MSEINEIAARQLIEKIRGRDEFLSGDDGFVRWYPAPTGHGYLSAWMLRAIADELDRRNEQWEKIIEAELGDANRESVAGPITPDMLRDASQQLPQVPSEPNFLWGQGNGQ